MEFYTPEAPAEAYAGMRKKLWWSNFTKLSASRFNMWYLILLLGISGGVMAYSNTCEATAAASTVHPIKPEVTPNSTVTATPVEEEIIVTPAVVEVPAQVAVEAPSPVAVESPKKEETAAASTGPTKSTRKKQKDTPLQPDVAEPVAAPIVAAAEAPAQKDESIKQEAPKKKSKTIFTDIYIDQKDKETQSNEN